MVAASWYATISMALILDDEMCIRDVNNCTQEMLCRANPSSSAGETSMLLTCRGIQFGLNTAGDIMVLPGKL